MGGCATKPKESDILAESVHTEDCAASKKADGETSAQGTENGVESQREAPLVDISKEENGNSFSEPKTVEAPPVSVEAVKEAAKTTTEDKVEAPANESNDKVEAGKETQEPAKEEQAEAKTDKSDAPPSSEDRSDAPVATA